MPKLPVKRFRPDTSNVDVLNAIRKNASNLFQSRVPYATQANIQESQKRILDYHPLRNEFMDALVNQIGEIIVRSNSWSNPLSKFKRGMLEYGDTIEEVQLGLAKSYTYDADREYLERMIFGQHRVDAQSSFHKINRQEFYAVSVNRDMLRRAFTSSNGLITLVNGILEAAQTSDNLDEFLCMTRLFREYHNNDGFFNINVPNVADSASTEAQAKALLRSIRSYADTLTFISPHYNAAGMPVFAPKDRLELFVTPEVNAAIDVNALAAAFNVDRADVPMRITVVPEEHFNMPGTQAILTTTDFFVIADTLLETRNADNPVGLHENYFLHHHQIISASRFVPAIRFSTDPSTEITTEDTPVTGVEPLTLYSRDLTTQVTEATRGELHQVIGSAVTTPEGGVNDAVRLALEGATSQWTYITNTGTLHIGPNETADSVTVIATSVDDADFSATLDVPVTGDILQLWPNPQVIDGDGEGTEGAQGTGDMGTFSAMSKTELQDVAEQLGVDSSGTKAEIRERVETAQSESVTE